MNVCTEFGKEIGASVHHPGDTRCNPASNEGGESRPLRAHLRGSEIAVDEDPVKTHVQDVGGNVDDHCCAGVAQRFG